MITPSSDTFVSVVVAARDKAAILDAFVYETTEILRAEYANYEVVVVDDGSTDDTPSKLAALLREVDCVRVLRLSRPFGRESAMLAGLESSIGDFVVLMEPGFDPPGLIPDMVSRCRAGSGVIVGRPAVTQCRSWWEQFGSRLFHLYCRRVLKIELSEGARTFFTLSRAALNAVLQVRDRVRFLRHLAVIVGFRAETVGYEPLPDGELRRKRTFNEDLVDGLTMILANSRHPMRVVTFLGVAASGLNLLYMLYIVLVYFLKTDVAEGWTTLSMQNAVMFFHIFVILTVLAEYIGLILQETQDRPAYFVAAETTSNVVLKDPTRRNIVTEPA